MVSMSHPRVSRGRSTCRCVSRLRRLFTAPSRRGADGVKDHLPYGSPMPSSSKFDRQAEHSHNRSILDNPHSSLPPVLDIARWLVSAELDLRPFYRIAAPHPIMGPITKWLRGLKPLRPLSLFEMAIVAITEQQLSLAAAFHIRTRLINRFGTPTEGLWIFPNPVALAEASLSDLRACGLSRRKAEYVRGIATRVVKGSLNFDALKRETTQEAYAYLMDQRGFGDWSAQYILARGFGRPDCLPSGDTGLRRAVGKLLARGRRLSPRQLERALSPFAPFRGLAAFYLSVAARLRPGRQ